MCLGCHRCVLCSVLRLPGGPVLEMIDERRVQDDGGDLVVSHKAFITIIFHPRLIITVNSHHYQALL